MSITMRPWTSQMLDTHRVRSVAVAERNEVSSTPMAVVAPTRSGSVTRAVPHRVTASITVCQVTPSSLAAQVTECT